MVQEKVLSQVSFFVKRNYKNSFFKFMCVIINSFCFEKFMLIIFFVAKMMQINVASTLRFHGAPRNVLFLKLCPGKNFILPYFEERSGIFRKFLPLRKNVLVFC
jgi:hypothetical protein